MATISSILQRLASRLRPSAVCSVCGHTLAEHKTNASPESCTRCTCPQFQLLVKLPARFLSWTRAQDDEEEHTPVETTLDEDPTLDERTHEPPLCVCGHRWENHLNHGARGGCMHRIALGATVCPCVRYQARSRSKP